MKKTDDAVRTYNKITKRMTEREKEKASSKLVSGVKEKWIFTAHVKISYENHAVKSDITGRT